MFISLNVLITPLPIPTRLKILFLFREISLLRILSFIKFRSEPVSTRNPALPLQKNLLCIVTIGFIPIFEVLTAQRSQRVSIRKASSLKCWIVVGEFSPLLPLEAHWKNFGPS